MIRPVFARLNRNPLSLRGRVRACPVLDTGVGAFPIILASALFMLLALAVACGSETAATSAPAPTAMPQPTDAPPATAELQPAATQVTEGHQPTPPAALSTTQQPGQAEPSEQSAATSPPPQGEGQGGGESLPTPSAEQATAQPLDLNVIMATTVLEVGEQRVAFLLTTPTGLVKGDTEVSITPVYLPDSAAGESIVTRFHQWPYGVRGAFAANVDFDRPGQWRLDITAEGPDGGHAMQEIEILEDSSVPFIGTVGPLSENKTLGSAGAIELVTTDYSPDLSLYEVTIREAVESPLPAVVVFASPAFCTTATCGPQVDAVSELRETYVGQAHFIHVEIYDNPDEIQGDLDRAQIAPTVDEWGLTAIPHWFNESWTFVLDADGRIQDRFEGFATVVELEEALQSALN